MRGLAAPEVGAATAHVDRTCAAAMSGRRAARQIAEWAKRFGLTEAELQILWQLRSAPNGGLDQTALANSLAFSPAQISASVERLRAEDRICPIGTVADRRRHHWRLSAAGSELINHVLVAAATLRRNANAGGVREAAA
jgi:DNA-binding MarR family transcriptional regulator